MAADLTPAERTLSLLDAAFFLLESEERMFNVGPLMILRPPAGSRSAKAFADRLLRELKKRPVAAPFDMTYQPLGLQGLPRLVRAAEVRVEDHCHRHTLPAPGTDRQLFDFVCRLHEQRPGSVRPGGPTARSICRPAAPRPHAPPPPARRAGAARCSARSAIS